MSLLTIHYVLFPWFTESANTNSFFVMFFHDALTAKQRLSHDAFCHDALTATQRLFHDAFFHDALTANDSPWNHLKAKILLPRMISEAPF